jgi:serine phosphatase RsbU (regulator of sigma subunit)
VASALRQAEAYNEALDLHRAAQELDFASEIQSSFFPDKIPVLPGWELAVTIMPAREMSGDFFDFIPLDEDHLGILIADVTDKGVGPALYMALSRTLIRTYAIEYQFEPDTIFFAANRRILEDARARLFVTAFFGVLNIKTGVFTYSNAGHNAPYLLRANGGPVEPLRATGMPIGIDEESVWEQVDIELEPGDVLLLYTDGIPDAMNEDGDLYEEETFIDVAQVNATEPAFEIQAAIIDQLQNFVGEAAQVDDITLMILRRDEAEKSP